MRHHHREGYKGIRLQFHTKQRNSRQIIEKTKAKQEKFMSILMLVTLNLKHLRHYLLKACRSVDQKIVNIIEHLYENTEFACNLHCWSYDKLVNL